MKCLNNDAKTSDFETVRIVVKEDLGKEIEDVFDEFNPQPIASASLA